jgi:hypothetical protein
MAKKKINVEGFLITIDDVNRKSYISLTDIARRVDERTGQVLGNWLRNAGTLDFLFEWETIYNPGFNVLKFEEIRKQAGRIGFVMSAKQWIETTGAIGIVSKPGRYGGTYAHHDIALEFCSAVSARFKLLLIREFQRLKEEEMKLLGESWNIQRLLTKANFHLQTAAVRENLVPLMQHNTKRESFYHASEADQLNLIVFGMTAKQWKQANPEKKGNLRDHATKLELVILNNLQAINSVLISDGMAKEMRANKLLKIAATQMEVLLNIKPMQLLDEL